MLEIKNVSKIYKAKGGVPTKALDDVSINFGETGLVFLLGKSGSGKSTLLNVSGGLDEPTSGEIIVKGKSSKDFTGSDFDSYRNTFVGFIFQEYNILDEFNVEDNIALALELQGKPKDREKINALLAEVDLESYAKRKPNTLSGGQKQRIAIARALIKEPQIIMADEPTGALDSATGKQVFDTLKKLSETRLVIVVSHDREFAEIYGDRIVELKDGKIISDVTKRSIAPQSVDKNINAVGNDTLTIKSGAELTDKNIATIKEFLKKSEGDIIITRGEKSVAAFRKATRMAEDGATESFSDTASGDVALKSYSAEESKFIRSRLPAAKAIKIGASGLKLKPLRLFFTILLSFIAFTMFGLLSTLMTYDGDAVAARSFANSEGYNYLNIGKQYVTHVTYSDRYSYEWTDNTRLTEKEVDGFASRYGSTSFGYRSANYSVAVGNVQAKGDYYKNGLSQFAYLPAGNPIRTGLTGEYPKNAGEIAVSSYLVDTMKNSDVYALTSDGDINPNSKLTIQSASDIIGKDIIVSNGGYSGGTVVKVTGVFDSGAIPAEYDSLKDENAQSDYISTYKFQNYLAEEMHQMALVSSDFFDENSNLLTTSHYYSHESYFDSINGGGSQLMVTGANDYEDSGYFSGVQVYGAKSNQLKTDFFDGERTTLQKDEIVVRSEELFGYFQHLVSYYYENGGSYGKYRELYNDVTIYFRGEYNDSVTGEWTDATAEQWEASKSSIDLLIDYYGMPAARLMINNIFYDVEIVGVFFENEGGVYMSQDNYDKFDVYVNETKYESNYKPSDDEIYDGVFIPYDHTEATFTKLLGEIGLDNITEDDVIYTLNASLYESVEMANTYADLLSQIFLYVGLVFAVFSALLMFNFISMSISNKRKEIGILRAVGARGLDVFKIFFAESGIIVGICTLLSIIGTLVLCIFINGLLKSQINLAVSLFVFGWLSVVIMLALALAIALISTFLPVYFAARKKPVESIRAL